MADRAFREESEMGNAEGRRGGGGGLKESLTHDDLTGLI